jgi:L-alanine-DL-glutamate epimerase-like enolase superfamily enzyme
MTSPTITHVQVLPAVAAFGAPDSPLLLLVAEGGLAGIGELWPGETEDVVEAVEAVAPLLLGADPLNREALWQSLRSSTRDWEDSAEVICGIVAACDGALLDLAARSLNVPAWALLGGRCRAGVDLCVDCGEAQNPQSLEDAARLAAEGVRTIGLTVPRDGEDRSIPLRRAGRTIGAEVLIIARPAEAAATVDEAVELGGDLDRAEPYLVEGLLADGSWSELAQVRDRIASATAAGHSTFGFHRFWRPIEVGCADVVTLRVDGAQGPSGILKLADVAGLRGIRVAVEGAGLVSSQAAAHACAARVNSGLLRLPVATCDALQEAGLLQDGRLVLPAATGLGVPDEPALSSRPLAVFEDTT